METKMLANDTATIMQKSCDSLITSHNNAATMMTLSCTPNANVMQNIDHCDENSNSSCSTTIIMEDLEEADTAEADATEAPTTERDQENNEKKFRKQIKMQRSESFPCDSASMMSCCSDNEMTIEDESDAELREEEIFYDSTNENEDLVEQATEEDFSLTKLYLNDIEIDSKEEEQTVTDLVKAVEKDNAMQGEQNKSMRVAFGVILRILFPLANGVVQGIKGIRDVRFLKVLRSIASSRQALTNLFAFAANTISLNLSSVQVSHRIEPILKLLKIRKSKDGIESLPDSPTSPHSPDTLTPPMNTNDPTQPVFSPFSREPRYSLPNFQSNSKKISMEEYIATKCCTLNILAEPPPGQPIRADIVFIHGLHGSLVNTWKQGLWENERRPVEFERPPKPPVRPPKRPRHSRSSVLHPTHHQKRARFGHADVSQRYSHEKDSIDEADENSYSFICGEPKDVQICDGIEYSFPTFRLRLNDNGRLLQAEHPETRDKPTEDNRSNQFNDDNKNDKEQTKKQKSSKPSPNDPNYSKCWPGDWLPIDCPGVRVIALNYTTDQHLWRPLWKKKEQRSNLIQRSREMTELLIKHRVGYGHPIVWVGHSKGGLFIKQIIVDAWESGRPTAAPFWRSARGVFFYSVPHRGSHLASIKAPLLLRSVELIDIEKNNKYLLDLHRRFAGLYHMGHLKIEVFSFVETALTLMSVLYMRIVGVDSADPGIGDVCGIRLDHREICKPRSRDCILYKQLVNMINKVC